MVEYSEIRITSCLQFPEELPCDLFIRLGPEKYTKVFNRGSNLDLKRLAKYQKKGVTALWISKNERKSYLLKVENRLLTMQQTGERGLPFIHTIDALCSHSLDMIWQEQILSQSTYKMIKTATEGFVDLANREIKYIVHFLSLAKQKPQHLRHLLSTAVFSLLLAKADGNKNQQMLNIITTAALLHDVALGNSGPELDEFSARNKAQSPQINFHPLWLSKIDSQKVLSADIRTAIEQHHEAWDGTGYPNRIKSLNIYYPARILAIADHFHHSITATSDRPALSIPMALLTMRQSPQFDPQLVKVFLSFFENSKSFNL